MILLLKSWESNLLEIKTLSLGAYMPEKIKKVSMSNTKKELLDAYNELVLSIKEEKEAQLNPQKIAEEKEKKETVKKVDGVNLDSINKSINNLKTDVNTSLNSLERNLENEIKKYEDIQKAIKVKETELQEVYEIEKNAHTLAALIESQNKKKVEFEEEMEQKRSTTLKEIETMRAEWEKEKKEHEAAVKERDEKQKKEEARKREEFEYNFKREKQFANDKLQDELNKKEKEFNQKLEAKQEELDKREAAVKGKEDRLSELENKVAQFQKEMDEEIAKAVDANTKKLQAEFKSREDYLVKEFEGEKNVLNTKLQSYEKTIAEQEKKINELSKKLDEAYSKVQDVAVRTIESASNTKAYSELQKAFSEKYSQKPKE